MGDQPPTGPPSPQPGRTPSPQSPPAPPGTPPPSTDTSPFTDRLSKRVYARQSRNRILLNAFEAGILTDDDEVLIAVPVTKLSPGIGMTMLIGLLPGIIALSMQRQSMFVVTDRQVVVFPFFSMYRRKPKGEALKLNRPVGLALAQTPKPSHTFGNKVTLPTEIAQFLGRRMVYVMLGNIADYGFQLARTPPS